MKSPRVSLADIERLTKGPPGKTLRFVSKKLRGREHIRGAKAQAIEDAAVHFSKDPRTIARYLKAAGPLQNVKAVMNASVDVLRLRDAETAKVVTEISRQPLQMLAFIQRHLTPEDRAKCLLISDNVIDVYNIALIKAGALVPAGSQKQKKVHDRK